MTDIWAHSAASTAALIAAREISARAAAESALSRLDAVNGTLNAVVDPMHDEALTDAERIDAALARGEDPGPLAGVPITIKINVDTAGRPTTNGLRLQKDLVAAEDSPVVANLRKAGAVIIGRTNTPAFSLRWFTRNSLHGATRNPHDAAITPGGSSGGAGAATAAGIGAIGHGTDIAGSVRYPAYACNLHGLRPTLGRVPNGIFSGHERTISAQITVKSGPLARRIEDVRLGYEAMAQQDLRDPWWTPAPGTLPTLPRRAAVCTAPEGLAVHPAVREAIERAAQVLADAGWEVDEVDPPSFREAGRINLALWMLEFRTGGLPKLEAEDDPDAREAAGHLLAAAEDAGDPLEALTARATLVRRWQLFHAQWPVLLCPVSAEPPFPDQLDVAGGDAFDRVLEAQLTQLALPALGLPCLSVATGRPGSPMGVQLVAGRFREDMLLDAGAVIEAAHPPIAPVDPFVANGPA